MPQYFITFGHGDRLRRNSYTIVQARDAADANEKGYALYGNDWSMAYPEKDGRAVVKRWDLAYIAPGS